MFSVYLLVTINYSNAESLSACICA